MSRIILPKSSKLITNTGKKTNYTTEWIPMSTSNNPIKRNVFKKHDENERISIKEYFHFAKLLN